MTRIDGGSSPDCWTSKSLAASLSVASFFSLSESAFNNLQPLKTSSSLRDCRCVHSKRSCQELLARRIWLGWRCLGAPDRVMHAARISKGYVQKEGVTCKPQWQGQRQCPRDHWVRSPAVYAGLPWRRHDAALPGCSASSPLLLHIPPPAPSSALVLRHDDIAVRARAK